MAEAMVRIERHGYQTVLSVHDQAVARIRKGRGSKEHFEQLLAEPPAWAGGLPIAASGWIGRRYRK
ncbi:hypothetical protein [Dongia mobilis]|uniref:hypothetical protein n=1 Tax=Dongia sp. TaxID=1977262 RepID=UPI0026EC095C